ncbi:MAG: hypothetical protein R3E60_06820 [Alphaproteobacteria bacterium]
MSIIRYGKILISLLLLAHATMAASIHNGEWWGILGERVPETCTDEEVGNVYDLLITVSDDKISGGIYNGDIQLTKLSGSLDSEGGLILIGKLNGRPLKLAGKFDSLIARGTWVSNDQGEWCAMHD